MNKVKLVFALLLISIASYFYFKVSHDKLKSTHISYIYELNQLQIIDHQIDTINTKRFEPVIFDDINSLINKFYEKLEYLKEDRHLFKANTQYIHSLENIEKLFAEKEMIIERLKSRKAFELNSLNTLLDQSSEEYSNLSKRNKNIINQIRVLLINTLLKENGSIEDVVEELIDECEQEVRIEDKYVLNFISVARALQNNSYGTKQHTLQLKKFQIHQEIYNTINLLQNQIVEHEKAHHTTTVVLMIILILMLFGIFAYYIQLDDTKRNLESFKSAVEDSYNIVVMTNTKKEITYVNDVFEKVTGYSKEEVIGQNPRILKSGTLEEQFYLHMNEVISSGKKWKGRFVNKTKNSELFYEDATITPIFYQGELSGYLAIKADVTQQVKYEKELEYLNHHLEEKIEDEVAKNLDKEKLLMKQSKMASLGEMMDAIAHQWKQPLNIINMQTSFLEMQNVSGTMNTKMVSKTNEAIFNQVKHLTETIDDFRKFFRVDVKKEHIIIEEVIEQVLSLEKSLLVKNKIETDLASSKHDYHLIASEFKHVFINLINNSIDAFNDNSIKNRVLKFAVSKDDRFINISVIDSAGGIPSHVIDNIFTANFTTKAEGKGTGIGLYMSTNIVLKLGGSIEVENTDFEFEGENVSGAKFIIKLPLLD